MNCIDDILIWYRILEVLESLCEGDDSINMESMRAVINHQLRDTLNKLVDSPHYDIALSLTKDFLYGNTKQDTDVRLNKVAILRDLIGKPASYWRALIMKYLVNNACVAISGEPSCDLTKEIEEAEKKRVAEQKEKLQEEGLAEKKKLLELAIKENEIKPPADLLASIPVASVNSIRFPSIKTSCNYRHDSSMEPSEKFPLDKISISFQLDDIKTKFVTITAVMDSTGISEELRQYLVLYTEVIRESPIMRNGSFISLEDVKKEFAADTINSDSSIGVFGSGYRHRNECGIASMCVVLQIRVEMERYVKAVQWLHELMYDVQFDVECLKTTAKSYVDEYEGLSRTDGIVAKALLTELTSVKGSNEYLASMMRQNKFLSDMIKKLEDDPSYSSVVLEKLNQLKVELTDPARLRVHMSAHVDRLVTQTGLSEAVSVWSNVFLPSAQQKYRVKSSLQRDYELQKPYPTQGEDSSHGNLTDSSLSLIIGLESADASYLYLTTPCLTEFTHADVPAIAVFKEYLTDNKGPLWKESGGPDVAFSSWSSYRFFLDLDCGYLQLALMGWSNIVDTYRLTKKIVENHAGDEAEFDAGLIESCKSNLILETTEKYGTSAIMSSHSLVSYLGGMPHGYNRWIMERIPDVSVDDMRRVSKLYFTSLFSPTQSKLAMCTKPEDVEEIRQKFIEEFGRELTVVKSLEEPYLVNM